jgi:hypothetical protein
MQRTLLRPLLHYRHARWSGEDRLSVRMQPLGFVEFGDGGSCGATHISKTAHAHEDEGVEPAVSTRAGDVSTVDFLVGRPVVAVAFVRARVQFAG